MMSVNILPNQKYTVQLEKRQKHYPMDNEKGTVLILVLCNYNIYRVITILVI